MSALPPDEDEDLPTLDQALPPADLPTLDQALPAVPDPFDAVAREAPPDPPLGFAVAAPDWQALEETITDRVLARLLERGENLVNPWLQAALAEVLTRHLHALGQDLQATLDDGLAEIVTRTVADELARHRARTGRTDAPSSPASNDT